MSLDKRQLLVILGPTATGKTDLALSLAKKFNGELVSCDSRQVYTGLDIGTGKLPNGKWKTEDGRRRKGKRFWWLDGVKVWMYDVLDPKIQYTVADYVKEAGRVIREIRERGKLPIIVGGTGLYLKALSDGLPNLTIPLDPKLRGKLEKLSLQQLQERLQELSPDKWEEMNTSDRQNPRRLIRAIEISSVRTPPRCDEITPRRWKGILKIGLTTPRNILYQRADQGVVDRIGQGMIEELKTLHKNGLSLKRMRQLGLEYGVLADFLQGRIKAENELIRIMQSKIHGFIRRQLTWFKKEKDVLWFDISEENYVEKIVNHITKWYDKRYVMGDSV